MRMQWVGLSRTLLQTSLLLAGTLWVAACAKNASTAPGENGIPSTGSGGKPTTGDAGNTGGGSSINVSATDAGRDTGSTACEGGTADGGSCFQVADAGPYCGDGIVNATGEVCDDGNKLSGDGCYATCAKVEDNYTCPSGGGKCTSTIRCGDGKKTQGVEVCDDGNTNNGDGCSSSCKLESGYHCPTEGQACVKNASCGDGRVTSGETCDDSNTNSGDGCSDQCATEDGYRCRAGQPCTKLSVCGDGKVVEGKEECDDGNTNSGDGCSSTCRKEADYYDCPATGGSCTDTSRCGNGRLEGKETCDDGDNDSGDGCTADCQVENGYQCRMAGKACVPKCGDSQIVGTEQCDDNNDVSGDGCSSTCLIEPGYACTTSTPSSCTASKCGNSQKEVGESCDQGDNNGLFYGDGSGCSKTCTQEPRCRNEGGGPTRACDQVCGDGNKDPDEGCDDGNGVSGDGCSDKCVVEGGFTCTEEKLSDAQPCPSASGQQCLVLPVIYRDFEGQQVSGGHPDFFYLTANASGGRKAGVVSGATTTTCVPNASGTKATWAAGAACPNTDASGPCLGLVAGNLGNDGKPAYAKGSCNCVFTDWDRTNVLGTCPTGTMNNCTPSTALGAAVQDCWVDGEGSHRLRVDTTVTVIESADSFKQWYTDSDFSTKVLGKLELAATAGGQYQFSSSRPGAAPGAAGRTVYDDLHDICLAATHTGSLTTGFFPLEDQARQKVCNIWPYWLPALGSSCCASSSCPVKSQWDPLASYDNCPTAGTGGPVPKSDGSGGSVTGVPRNFYFTTEVRYLFRYDGTGGTLAFFGDDDVWVFINGRLALDLGAPHERVQGSVVVNSTFGLTAGNTYEIAIFHADRHPRESNYQLTLTGFGTTRSVCTPKCGDGTITAGEECDNGSSNNNTEYGGCTTQCKFGPFCGDGEINGQEECDDGRNTTVSASATGCGPGCKFPPRCGDGRIDAGEECDDGANNKDGQYNGCSTKCILNPYCGDTNVDTQFGEECDDGVNVGGYGYCDVGCKMGPRCGDQVVQSDYGEECDEGSLNGQDGHCNADCGVPGYCGDGIKQENEQCDDPAGNNGEYNGCNPDCTLAGYCGDGVKQEAAGEKCDFGSANTTPAAAEYGGCLVDCTLGPRCGDGVTQAPIEQCDDANTNETDLCNSNCMRLEQVS